MASVLRKDRFSCAAPEAKRNCESQGPAATRTDRARICHSLHGRVMCELVQGQRLHFDGCTCRFLQTHLQSELVLHAWKWRGSLRSVVMTTSFWEFPTTRCAAVSRIARKSHAGRMNSAIRIF